MLGAGGDRPYRLHPRPLDGFFLAGSNGLASGNHPIEAVDRRRSASWSSAMRVALWQAGGIRRKRASALDLASIDDPDCRALLAKYAAAGIAVRVWNVTTDIGVAAFLCEIRDAPARRSGPAAPLPGLRLPSRSGDRAEPGPDRGGADPADLYRRHPRRPAAGGIRGTARMPISPMRCSTRWRGESKPVALRRRCRALPATIWRDDLRWAAGASCALPASSGSSPSI